MKSLPLSPPSFPPLLLPFSFPPFSPIPPTLAVIGAPTLQVEFKAEEVEVVMADPVLRVLRPLTDCYSKVSYVLRYWRKDRPDHVMTTRGRQGGGVVRSAALAQEVERVGSAEVSLSKMPHPNCS